MKRIITAICMALLLAACGSNPERDIQKGYQAATNTVRATTVLVNRDAITVDQAKQVRDTAVASKASLDAAADTLRKCRATESAGGTMKCESATGAVSLWSSVLLTLESYTDKLLKK